jgi:hypothetical protein
MTNFVAFKFCDNDFHVPLQEAIYYVVENRCEELTLDAFQEFVLRAMVAFNSLRRISNHETKEPYAYLRYRKYFEDTLTVTEVKTLDELVNFEGYIFDKFTMQIFYKGY